MKARHFILPCVALAAAAFWIIPQRQAISEAEATIIRLRNVTPPENKPAEVIPTPLPERKPINWKDATRRFSLNDMTPGERQAFRDQLAALSREELLAALEEIGSMDLPGTEKLSLQRTLFNHLSKVDPAEAFSRYGHLFLHEGHPDSLAYALKNWAAKDAAAAAGWLDKQIQADEFSKVALDGTNERRMALEGALFPFLLKSDPASAEERIAAYPPEQRRSILNANNESITESLQAPYSRLIRSLMPQDQQAGMIGALVYQYTFTPTASPAEAYQQIGETMERIQATQSERELMASRAAISLFQDMADRGKVLPSDVEALREWATAQALGTTGELTGKALAAAVARTRNLSYTEAAAMIRIYHEAEPDDSMIQAFLRGEESQNHMEEAVRLAEQIKDPDIRVKATTRLRLNILRP